MATDELKNDGGAAAKPKLGCGGWLGLLFLVLSAAAVVFFLVVKPKLEERGVDVDAKLDELGGDAREMGGRAVRTVRESYDKVRARTPEAAAELKERSAEVAERAADKAAEVGKSTGRAAEQVMDEAGSWY